MELGGNVGKNKPFYGRCNPMDICYSREACVPSLGTLDEVSCICAQALPTRNTQR